jgi:hypothetical protein
MAAKQDIIDLETKFWDTMISKDANTASSLLTKKSIVIGPQGVSEIARGDFAKMMDGSKWTLESYKLSDVQVLFPTDETAIIGYKVRQKGTMDGKPYDMQCADSSTWIMTNGAWQCALHTETVMDGN